MKKKTSLYFFTVIIFLAIPIVAEDLFNLNYDQVEISKVSEDIAKFTNKTILIDPRVKGKVKLISPTKLNKEQIWDIYINTLEVLGFSITKEKGFYRIIPESEALKISPLVNTDKTNKYSSELITLENRNVSTGFVERFKPILSRQSYLSIFPEINSFLIIDKDQNIQKIKNIVKSLDRINGSDVSVISLNNMSAIEGVRIISKLKESKASKISDHTALAFMPTNSIVLVAEPVTKKVIEDILLNLDSEINSDEQIDVVYLKHAKAEDIASILTTVSSSFVSEGNTKKTIITSHENTNSLVLSADQSVLEQLKKLISKLDIRRAQVLVEAIIVDLSEEAAQKLGVEAAYQSSDSESFPVGLTRFNSGNSPDLLSIVGSTIDENDQSLSTSALSSLLNTQGLIAGLGDYEEGKDNFVGILNAIASDADSNILSTPSVLATDNEIADLFVGQEIPITTGESLGNNNSNPFRTTSRQEVGIKLEVVPQINEGGAVLLKILAQISGVASQVGTSDFITNKREIETTVLVDNNQTIVLGGLIKEDISENESRVPILGAIPVLGNIFKSRNSITSQKNLTIFIRPKIIVNSDEVNMITNEKYNYIKAQKLLNDSQINYIDLTKKQLNND